MDGDVTEGSGSVQDGHGPRRSAAPPTVSLRGWRLQIDGLLDSVRSEEFADPRFPAADASPVPPTESNGAPRRAVARLPIRRLETESVNSVGLATVDAPRPHRCLASRCGSALDPSWGAPSVVSAADCSRQVVEDLVGKPSACGANASPHVGIWAAISAATCRRSGAARAHQWNRRGSSRQL